MCRRFASSMLIDGRARRHGTSSVTITTHIFYFILWVVYLLCLCLLLILLLSKGVCQAKRLPPHLMSLVYFFSSFFRVEDLATKANRANGWTKSANGTLCRHTFGPSLQCLWKTQRYYPADFYWRTASDVIRWRNWRDRLGRSVGCRSATGRCALTCFLANHHCGSLPTLYCI